MVQLAAVPGQQCPPTFKCAAWRPPVACSLLHLWLAAQVVVTRVDNVGSRSLCKHALVLKAIVLQLRSGKVAAASEVACGI